MIVLKKTLCGEKEVEGDQLPLLKKPTPVMALVKNLMFHMIHIEKLQQQQQQQEEEQQEQQQHLYTNSQVLASVYLSKLG
ncbi:Hypothetical predicted protein [Podarcis lilfordi]|uniref:Uncharacterized protein n=1 Tax=Podarcis lilfordi TaxID=74358 RepID=A0AA35JNR1_9SAUR|nr:Hypothetical predicted protein [Podarcis lilfordi]